MDPNTTVPPSGEPINPEHLETFEVAEAHKIIAGWNSSQRLGYANETRSLIVQGKQPSDKRLALALACLRSERTAGPNKGASKKGSKPATPAMSLDDL